MAPVRRDSDMFLAPGFHLTEIAGRRIVLGLRYELEGMDFCFPIDSAQSVPDYMDSAFPNVGNGAGGQRPDRSSAGLYTPI